MAEMRQQKRTNGQLQQETARKNNQNANSCSREDRRRREQFRRSAISPAATASVFGCSWPLVGLLICCFCFLLAPSAQAMPPPMQLLRMYSSNGHRPLHVLSRKMRDLGNAYLAQEGAKIRQLEKQHFSSLVEKRTPSEFEVLPGLAPEQQQPEAHQPEGNGGRDLLLNELEEVPSAQQQQQKEELPMMEEEDEDSAVLAAAAAAGLLRQERNEPNAAAPKMYARHIGDLGGTMFRFGR